MTFVASKRWTKPLVPCCPLRTARSAYVYLKAVCSITKSPQSSLSMPVYSLSTRGSDARPPTLNLITYASPISINPPRYAIALYRGTLSKDNFIDSGHGVLQILGRQHAPLFELLGKCSGRDVDKYSKVEELGYSLVDWNGHKVLSDCFGRIEVQLVKEQAPVHCGDHDVIFADILDSWHIEDDSNIEALYTQHLRDDGYM